MTIENWLAKRIILMVENALQRLVQRIAGTQVAAKLSSVLMHRVDGPALKATGGRVAPSAILTGLPVALVTTRGAKSGLERTIPLVVIPVEDKLVLIGSNWGGKRYPAWYHNLRVHPSARVNLGGRTKEYSAREAMGEEYERYWNEAVKWYAGYEAYRERTGGRMIPVMVLEKVQD